MKARSVLLYSVLRLLAFLVPFGILMLFPVFRELPWLAAVFAALIGLSLSLLLLRRPLAEATSGLAERRARTRPARRPDVLSDEDAEDAAAARAAEPAAVPSASSVPSPDERPEQQRSVGD